MVGKGFGVIRLRISIGLLATLAAGCTISMSREEQVENILSAPSLETSLSSAENDDVFTFEDWPERNWWERYGSVELNGLIEQALQNNPTVQSVRSRLEFAKENAIVVRSNLYPIIYFNASDQWQYLSENGLYRALNPNIPLSNQLIDFSLSFSYEFDFWGKYRNLYRAALGRAKAAEAETAQAELIAATALAQAYFALKTNLVRKRLYEELFEVRKNYAELERKLEAHSLDSALEPLLSEERAYEAKEWVLSVEEEIAVNVHLVNILAGKGPDEPLDLEESLPALPEKLALPREVSLGLLSRRPDFMAQIWRVDALARDVGAARAEFWPDVNVVGLLGFQSGSWSKLFEWVSRTVGAAPGLSLPVFTAGAIGANASAKLALYNEAVYQYNELILSGFQEVADLLAIGRSVYKQKEQQDKVVRNASIRYELTQLRGKNGLDDALTVYRFLEEKIQKQLDDVQLLYSEYLVSVRLIKALGGGYLFRGPDGC